MRGLDVTVVRILAPYRPDFPAKCIRCGCPEPAAVIAFGIEHWIYVVLVALLPVLPWFADQIGWNGGSDNDEVSRRFPVPVCRKCCASVHAERRMPWLASLVILVTSIPAVDWAWQHNSGYVLYLWICLFVVIATLPLFLWHRVYPATLRISQPGSFMYFEFANPAVAREFAEINEVGIVGQGGL